MPTQVQFRRGTTTQVEAFTGAAGEVVYDTEQKTLSVQDGTTSGGTYLATKQFANSAFEVANAAYSIASGVISFTGTATLTDGPYNLTLDANGVVNFPTGVSGYAVIQGVDSVQIVSNTNHWTFGTDGTTTLPGTISSNLIPTTANSKTLGSSAKPWHDLYIGTGNVNIGGIALSNNNGILTVTGASDFIVEGAPNKDIAFIANTANAAFNTLNVVTIVANAAFDKANSANVVAQAGFDKANAANVLAQTTFDYANNILVYAQSAYQFANGTNTTLSGYISDVFANANNTLQYSQSAYQFANSVNAYSYSAYNKANNALANTTGTFGGSLTITGQANVQQRLAVGTGSYTVLPNLIAQFTGSSDTYSQINQQNLSANGSGDIVVTAPNGTDLVNYIDMGVAGNTYNNQAYNSWSMAYPNDGWLMVEGNPGQNFGGNVFIGTSTSGTGAGQVGDIVFIQGGNYEEVGRFALGKGLVVNSTTASSSNSTGALVVKGGVGIKGAVYADSVYDNGVRITTGASDAYLKANGAFDKANSANVIAQAAYDSGNSTLTYAQSGYAKANAANVLAQAAFDNSNTKFNSSGGTISGDTSITGNLTVTGTTFYANTVNLVVEDNIITLNSNVTGTPTLNAGFEVNRGNQSNTSLVWNETGKNWQFTEDGTNYKVIADAANVSSAYASGNNTLTYATAGFNKANLANVLAQNAYDSGNSTLTYATAGFNKANLANVLAQAAFDSGNNTLTYATAGFGKANTANVTAQAAFDFANSVNTYAFSAYASGNSTLTYATAGFNKANGANVIAQAAFDFANSVNTYAFSAYASGNSTLTYATAGFNKANTANVTAQASYDFGNTVNTYAFSAYSHSNNTLTYATAGFDKANAANVLAQSAYDSGNNTLTYATAGFNKANAANVLAQSAYDSGNNTLTYATAGFGKANAANVLAQSAYDSGNATATYATAGFDKANTANVTAQAAYNNANTKFASAGGTITGATHITDTTQSTTSTSGALIVDGGVGIAKNLNVGGDAIISGTLTVVGGTTTTSSSTVTYANPYLTLHDPIGNTWISSNDGQDIGIMYEYYDSVGALYVVTGGSGNGTTATLNISDNFVTPVGQIINISGVTPSGFNGSWNVTASAVGTVSFLNTTNASVDSSGALGKAQRVTQITLTAGTWSSQDANVSFSVGTPSVTLAVGKWITITDAAPSAYNGTYQIKTSGPGYITYTIGNPNPGAMTAMGKLTLENRHAFSGWANDSGYFEFYKSGNFDTTGSFGGLYGGIKAGKIIASPPQSISAAELTAGGFLQIPSSSVYDVSTPANGVVAQISTPVSMGIMTIASANANVHYTNSATLYIAGAPVAGNNVVFDSDAIYALEVATGNTLFGGDLVFNSSKGIVFTDGTKQTTNAATYTYSVAGFNKANAANVLAQSAYDSGNNTLTYATAGFNKANAANVIAQAGFDFANSVNTYAYSAYASGNSTLTYATAGFNKANLANVLAQSAYDSGNSTLTYATAGFNKANAANVLAQSSYDFANTVNTYAFSAYSYANATNTLTVSSYNKANAANVLAQSAYDSGNSTLTYATAGFAKANAANVLAQAAYDSGNSTLTYAQSGYTKANGAVQSAFVTVSANGNSITPSSNNDTLTITAASANGINVLNPSSKTIDFGLRTSGVTAGDYGSSTNIPVISVDAFGRITSASNSSISTSISLSGTSGTGSVSGGGTLTFSGNYGVTASASGSTITIATPQDLQTTASPSFNNLNVTGNLSIGGAYTYTNTAIYQTVDSLIELAANNAGDAVDIGFYGQYNSSGNKYAGLARSAGSTFVLFKDLSSNPTTNSVGSITLANYGTLRANLTGGMVSGLANTIGISDGGTNNSTYTTGALLQYNGTGIVSLANTGVSAGSYGNTTSIPSITVDAYGRVTAVSNNTISTSINLAANSGTGSVSGGGTLTLIGNTGIATYSTGSTIYINNTGVTSLATGSTSRITVSAATGNISVDLATTAVTAGSYNYANITVDSYGRVTSAVTGTPVTSFSGGTTGLTPATGTNGAITLAGTLGISNGGSNNTSYTTGQIIYYDGSSLTSLANSGVTAGSYGNTTTIPSITVDALGRVTAVSNNVIYVPPGTSITANSGQLTANSATGNVALGLATTTVSAGTYGSSSNVVSITVDSYGRITSASNVAVTATAAIVSATDTFTGNGVQTAFVLAQAPYNKDSTTVNINGVTQQRSTYSVTGSTLTLTTAAPSGAVVEVTTNYNALGSGTITGALTSTVDTFTADGATGAYTLTTTPSGINYTFVHVNGVQQNRNTYTLVGNVVTLGGVPTSGAIVEVQSFTSTSGVVVGLTNYGAANNAVYSSSSNTLTSGTLPINAGGSNATSYTSGQILYYNGTNFASLANSTASGSYTNASVTVDAYGRVTSASSGTTAVTSVSGTTGQIFSSGGTTPTLNLANTAVTTGTYGGATQIPVIAIDQFGRITSAANAAITVGTALTDDTTSATVHYPLMTVSTSGSIAIANTSSTKLSYVPSTGTLSATTFSGTLSGSATSATSATNAVNTTNANTTGAVATNSTYYPSFVASNSSSSQGLNTATALTFNPSTGTLSATVHTSTSDETLKENIAPITNALDIINNIDGVKFNWKDNGNPSAGLIAQQVEQYLPELITTADGKKSLNYNGIIAVLVEAIKAQQVQIDALTKKKKVK